MKIVAKVISGATLVVLLVFGIEMLDRYVWYKLNTKYYSGECDTSTITCSPSLSQGSLLFAKVYCSEKERTLKGRGSGLARGFNIKSAKERAIKMVCSDKNMNKLIKDND